MAKGQLNHILQYLRRLTGPQATEDVTEGELLERFVTRQDDDAFQDLVQRHGPMVLAVCQRVLANRDDAEDAFQATFLVLARKASAIRKQASLGSWLYRVAFHIAINARARAVRQRAREREMIDMPHADMPADTAAPELRRALDEELQQLPEKYRAPLVLCYLEGKTHEQAARELRWPIGSMSRRLARGQQLLQQRLVRRGVALSGLAVGEVIAHHAAAAAVPVRLVSATVKSAALFTAGQAAVAGSAPVTILAEEALRAMSTVKLKAAAVLLVVGLVSAGSAALIHHNGTSSTPPATEAALIETRPDTSREWGPPVNGLRLGSGPDRLAYRIGHDLVQVAFNIQNVSRNPYPVTMLRYAHDMTDLWLIGPDGKERFLGGLNRPAVNPPSWTVTLQPGEVRRISTVFDPAQALGGLSEGAYRLRGRFRYEVPSGAAGRLTDFALESNEVRFRLLPRWTEAKYPMPAGPRAGSCSLSLLLLEDRKTWCPGESPLDFAVVLHRLDNDGTLLRTLSAHQLLLSYRLEITTPDGRTLTAPQTTSLEPTAPLLQAGPLLHRLDQDLGPQEGLHALMLLQGGPLLNKLDCIPVGKRLGERFRWDPSGQSQQSLAASGPVGTGKHTVRAVYDVDEATRRRLGLGVLPRLESNPVDVEIADGK